MDDATRRRRLLAAGASAAVTGVAGCLSVLGGDARVPVELCVLNETEENLRVQATVGGVNDDVGPQFGDVYPLYPGTTEIVRGDVRLGRYTLRAATGFDDDPSIDRRVRWTVTERDCTHRAWAVFTEVDGRIRLSLSVQTCEGD